MIPKVTVLMSTYNGEKYIKQQIESILNQRDVEVNLFVRDDGSTDGTVEIINEYKTKSNVHLMLGENVGWKISFTELMHKVSFEEGRFYAFSDQDDIWKDLKLVRAVNMIKTNEPALYHSNVSIMNDDMQFISNRFSDNFEPDKTFPKSFLDGFGVGSTMVFNANLLKLVQKYYPKKPTNHDAFVIALAYMFGDVIYDKSSYIKYRRHAGAATSFGTIKKADQPTLFERYKRYKRNPKLQFSVRASEIINGYANMLPDQELKLLKKISNYRSNIWSKLYILLNPNVCATGIRKTLQVKYRIIFNTL